MVEVPASFQQIVERLLARCGEGVAMMQTALTSDGTMAPRRWVGLGLGLGFGGGLGWVVVVGGSECVLLCVCCLRNHHVRK